MVKTKRNTTGMKEVLFDELDSLRKGESTPQKARAVSALIGGIIATTRIEMDYARFVASAETHGKPKALEMK